MPGVFDQSTVDKVQQANNIVEVIAEYVSLSKRGREMVGVCPFHEDHRPSMYVNEVKQIFKCFACGAGGDVLKFIQMKEGLTFPQAIERLAERAGIVIRSMPQAGTGHAEDVDHISKTELAKINAWAADYFQANLHHPKLGKQARDYLASRHLSPESIKTWHIGLSLGIPNHLMEAARKSNISLKALTAAGFINSTGQDRFSGRLMFPIMDATSRVIGFGGRILQGEGAKYINSPATDMFDKSQCLYGLHYARRGMVASDRAVVVEGYTDCIMARQLGCDNVVATMGTSLTTGHGRILRRYGKTVILVFDGDVAGKEAAARGMDICLQQHIDIKIVVIPGEIDPCDYLLTEGPERFHELLDKAVDVLEFCWQRLLDRFQGNTTLSGKKAAMEQFLETIALAISTGNVSVLDQGLIVNRLSGVIGLETKQITSELNRRVDIISRRVQRRGTADSSTEPWEHPSGLRAAAEREILEVLLNKPDLYAQDGHVITADSFQVPAYKKAAEFIFHTIKNGGPCGLSQLLARIESVEMAALVTECARIGEEKGNFETRLRDALKILGPCGTGLMDNKTDGPDIIHKVMQRDESPVSKENRYSFGLTD